MKVILPVVQEGDKYLLSRSLARAEFLYIYDFSHEKEEILENTARSSPSGAGVKVGQLIVDTGSQALISPRCGSKAGRILGAGNVEIYKAQGSDVGENLEKFRNNNLELLLERGN